MTSQRTAMITGAARGIGAEISRRLAAKGLKVILVDVLSEVEETASLIKGQASFAMFDLARLDAIETFVRALVDEHGPIDIVVNNAGISPKHGGKRAPLEATSLEEWQSVIDVNLTASFLVTKAAMPEMRERKWGRIVNISSQAARTRSTVAGLHYAASKAGLLGLSRALAGEVGVDGVTVNCIAPGRIATPMADVAGDAVNTAYVQSIPVSRIGQPTDVAETVSFLASDEAGFITGAVIDVNGGHFMG